MKTKKFLVIGLALVLSLSLAGCKNNDDVQNTDNDDQVVSSGEINETSGEANLDEVSGEISDDESGEIEGEISGEETEEPGETPSGVAGIMTSLSETATVLVRAPMIDVIPADQSSTFIGLTQDEFEANVEDSVFFESMISPANESYCLIKVNDNADVNALKQTIFDNANPRKWICMSAERVLVVDSGRYILLAMGAKDSCDSMVDEFSKYFNGNVGTALDRIVEESSELPTDGGSMAL